MKRNIIIAGALAIVLAVAGAAFAFWTASGTGSGGAAVGTDSGVSIDPVTISGTLYPAGSLDVEFDVNNLSSDAPVQVDKVVADDSTHTNGVEVVAAPNADDTHACKSDWFHYSGSDVLARHIAASSSATIVAPEGGSLSMDDLADANQDGCKGATLVLHLKTDNSAIGG